MAKKQNMSALQQKLVELGPRFGLVLGVFFVFMILQQINYFTTHDSLMVLMSDASFATAFATAVILAEIVSLARVFSKATDLASEPKEIKIALAIWSVVIFFDSFLTFFYVYNRVQSANPVLPPRILWVRVWMPLIITVLATTLQFGTTLWLGAILDRFVQNFRKALLAQSKSTVTQPTVRKGQYGRTKAQAMSGGYNAYPKYQTPVPITTDKR